MNIMPTREMLLHYYVALEGFFSDRRELHKLQFALGHRDM